MANLTEDSIIETIGGPGPFNFDLPVDGGSAIFTGSLVSQLTATGAVVPYSTAASGVAVGVAQHGADNTGGSDGDKRVAVESKRMFAFDNDGGDPFSEANLIGSVVYGVDDHTVSTSSSTQTRKAVGFYMGLEVDGKVRVYVDPMLASIVDALQGLTDAPGTPDALRDDIVGSFG